MSRLRLGIAVAALMALLPIAPAHATFPGKNGFITFTDAGPTAQNPIRVRTLNPRTGATRTLVSCPLATCQLQGAYISPDGKTIVSQVSGPNPDGKIAHQIGLIDLATGQLRQIPFKGYDPYTPNGTLAVHNILWSPSSSALLVNAFNILSGNGVYLTSVDGTVGPQVWNYYGGSVGPVSPLGSIAYSMYVERGPSAPYVHELIGRDRPIADCSIASFAPDGKRMLCNGPRSLKIVRVDGRGRRHHLRPASIYGSAVWSPDGTKIAFLEKKGIYVMKSTGGRARLVLRTTQPSAGKQGNRIGTLDWQARP